GAVRPIGSEVLVEAHAHDLAAHDERLAVAVGDLDADAAPGLEHVAREQATAAAREVDHRRAPRHQARAERDLDAHRDALLAAALLAGVERAQDQEAQRLGVHGTPHEEVEADAPQLLAHRGRVLLDDDDADEAPALLAVGGREADGVDAARG